ncbi:MAG TPA: sulfatase [Fimbriiglobus sp.]|nr:sulfatase [Fimbriiglobus sp.]
MLRLALLVVALGFASQLTAAEKPNVVFILADDLGWTDLGCQGSKYYLTPNIDRMADHGMRFTAGYSCGPNCQPTRAALMSGQYGPRTGVYTVGGIDRFDWKSRPLRPVDNVTKLDPKVVTVAEALRAAGYKTGHFGKWHLGQDPAHHPLAQGFDESVVSMGRHFDFPTVPKVAVPKGAYLADWLTDKSVDFITRHKDGPFFLCLHHYAVHSPLQAKPELIAKFKDKPAVGGHHNPTYAAMIASVDESVGRVLKTLDDLKLSDNTLVVFTSDNGGVGGYVREGIVRRKQDTTDNAPLRMGKGSLYEGGVRVAFIARWPGTIQAGTVTDEPINSVDLYPTLLELAGAKPPAGQPLDGVSYVPTLRGKKRERGPLYWHFPGYLGVGKGNWRTTPAGSVRDGDWKLIEFFEDGRQELYNLKNDIGEKTNLAAKLPAKAKELHGKLIAWREQVGAKMPTKNK